MLTRPELPQAAKDLLAAADLLETGGHCKFRLDDPQGRHCAVGAIFAATNHDYNRSLIIYSHLQKALNHKGVVAWNNAPERTAQEVIDLFRATAYNLALVEV